MGKLPRGTSILKASLYVFFKKRVFDGYRKSKLEAML